VKTLDGLSNFSASLNGNMMLFVFIAIMASMVCMMVYSVVIVKFQKDKKE
jgi:hypothetical protein